jgi:hypothetical protein
VIDKLTGRHQGEDKADANVSPPTEKQVRPGTCTYCKSVNASSATVCGDCGAPLT